MKGVRLLALTNFLLRLIQSKVALSCEEIELCVTPSRPSGLDMKPKLSRL